MRRKTVSTWITAVLVTGLAGLSGAVLAADAPAPAPAPALPMASPSALAGSCSACHGQGGVSKGPSIPTIAGVNQEYFVETMMAFKNGKRHATVMNRVAKGFTDDEIKSMAKYFAGKQYVGHAQQVDPAKAARGKNLHKQNCEKCHEEGGRVSEDGGILAGQWMPYLTYQMEDFTTGKTKMSEKMEKKVSKLSAPEIEAIIHYYASQK